MRGAQQGVETQAVLEAISMDRFSPLSLIPDMIRDSSPNPPGQPSRPVMNPPVKPGDEREGRARG